MTVNVLVLFCPRPCPPSCYHPRSEPVTRPNSNVIARPFAGDVSFAFEFFLLLSLLLIGASGSMI